MRYLSVIAFLVVSTGLVLGLPAVFAQPQWTNICPDPQVQHCKNVGRIAQNNDTNPPALRGIKLGKIIGVAWRPKGSLIGYSEAIPDAGIPASTRTSPRDAYYYIIDDGWGEPFLRQCREIDAK